MPAGEDEDPLPSVLTQPPQNRCLVPPCKGLLPARPLKTPLERLSRRPVFFNRSIPMGFGSQPAAQEELFLCRHLKGEQQIADIRAFIFNYFLPSCLLSFGIRNAKRRAFRESRGLHPSGRTAVVHCSCHTVSKKHNCRRPNYRHWIFFNSII